MSTTRKSITWRFFALCGVFREQTMYAYAVNAVKTIAHFWPPEPQFTQFVVEYRFSDVLLETCPSRSFQTLKSKAWPRKKADERPNWLKLFGV